MKKLNVLLLTIPSLYFAQLLTPQGQIQATVNPETGNIGIGFNNPKSKLTVFANDAAGGNQLELRSTHLRNSDRYFMKNIISGAGNDDVTFSLRHDGQMFVDGNVGIGTPNPGAKLQLFENNNVLNFITNKRLNGSWPPVDDSRTMTIQSSGPASGNLAFATGNGERMRILDNGNIGIGTTTPQTTLDIHGIVTISQESTIQLAGNQSFHGLKYSRDSFANTFVDGPVLYGWSGGGLGIKKEIGDWFVLKWNAEGNVSISNKLEAKEIKVTNSPTADFVFENTYQLPKLENVEKHIKEKKHLPEIASAAQMRKEGVNIGEFQIKLLQKIEELTLYSIEQNKRIQTLENKIKTLKK